MLWVIMTKRDTKLTAEEKQRYDDLATDLFTNKPQYFVIMKGMRVDDKLDFPSTLPNSGKPILPGHDPTRLITARLATGWWIRSTCRDSNSLTRLIN